jgi:hypothetical protein
VRAAFVSAGKSGRGELHSHSPTNPQPRRASTTHLGRGKLSFRFEVELLSVALSSYSSRLGIGPSRQQRRDSRPSHAQRHLSFLPVKLRHSSSPQLTVPAQLLSSGLDPSFATPTRPSCVFRRPPPVLRPRAAPSIYWITTPARSAKGPSRPSHHCSASFYLPVHRFPDSALLFNRPMRT